MSNLVSSALLVVISMSALAAYECDGATPTLLPIDTPPATSTPVGSPTATPLVWDVPASQWTPGGLEALPSSAELRALPGGGEGPGVFTSNNPELLTGVGTLYQAARADPHRGGEALALSGRHRAYVHHLNRSGQGLYLHLLITNPNPDRDLTVACEGSGYNQTDTGGIGRGFGPDYSVAEDWLTGDFNHQLATTAVQPYKGVSGWVKSIPNGQEVDALIECVTSAPAYYYLIATASADTASALNLTTTLAPGDIASPGVPPPPFGREAGVYAHDTWRGVARLQAPAPGHRLGYMLNTATGGGLAPVQAFAALTHFADSSTEAVGMYGNLYDIELILGAAPGAAGVTVDVYMAAYGGGAPSSYFNGPMDFNGQLVPVWLTPSARLQKVGSVQVGAAETIAHLKVPIPGLSAIPQAIWLSTR